MELFTLDRNYMKQDIIDSFGSLIWTERYYGDGDVELVVPMTADNLKNLPKGIFLGIAESKEVMILESIDTDENSNLKMSGISLLSWMNNRFVRTSNVHADKYWYISDAPAGKVLWDIVYNMCSENSPYLDGSIDIGIPNPERLAIPGLALENYDTSGDNISVGVPYGPLYDAIKNIATTYKIGMQFVLESGLLKFRSYKGIDHSSLQTENPIVRFTPQMDSLANIKELQSIAALKTDVFAFAPGAPSELTGDPGVSRLSEQFTGFDLRALMILADDITTDMVGGNAQNLLDILNSRARDGLVDNSFVNAVDGEIMSTSQFKYGKDYILGDIIEVQGKSGIIQVSQITEYIRSQDSAGEKAYPTVVAVD